MEERQETTRTEPTIAHTDDDHFFLNLHALHNAARIRKVLPHHLTKPTLVFPDRQSKHKDIAAQLRVTGKASREASRAKAKATREKKQAEQAAQGKSKDGDKGSDVSDDSGRSGEENDSRSSGEEDDIDMI